MPDLHQTPVISASADAAHCEATLAMLDDFDYALGAECADPALQIERWRAECAGFAVGPS